MYRAHRFTYGHVLREVGASARDVYSLADVAQSDDIGRLADDQAERLYTLPGAAGWHITADRVGLSSRVPISRAIIPAGHNLGTHDVAVRFRRGSVLGSYSSLQVPGAFYALAMDDGLIEREVMAGSEDTNTFLVCETTPAPSTVPSLGEIVWSDIWQPTTGEVYDWEHPAAESNITVNVMQSGSTYISENGPALRAYGVQHRGVSGADIAGYARLFRAVGQSRPFWYDHSDSGDYVTVIDECNSTAGLILVNCTAGLVSSNSPVVANEAIELTSTGGDMFCARNFAAPVDFRGKRASVDLRVNGADATGAFDVSIQLVDTGGAQALAWYPSMMFGELTGDNWVRVYFDPSRPDSVLGSGPLDLGAVPRWQVAVVAPSGTVRVDNWQTYDQEKAPTLCRFESVQTRKQDNKVPRSSLGPTYTIDMELREVIG